MDYDDHGRVSHTTNIIDYLVSSTVYNDSASTYYQYNSDGTLEYEETNLPGSGSIKSEYGYDELLRVTGVSRTAGSFDHDISYTYYSQSSTTANLISTYKSTVNGIATTFGYTYDSKGNITKITNSGDDDITYTYDDLGQLTKEVKGNVTKTYTYDNAGNITSIITTTEIESLDPDPGFTPIIKAVTLPTTTTTTKTLSYTNSQWGDLLTSYDGTAITYDEIGNPLSYYNGSSYTFTWEGRRLVGATRGSNTMSFTYNDDGIRTSKTADGVTTTYYVNGGQIVAEKTDTRTIVYIYDASGAPIGMMYRTTSYAKDVWDTFWYEKNLQGDIIAIYNASGTKVATYTYSDAWGNHSVSYSNGGGSTGAQYNPFRYRGYYYDSDLGMYYLQSRYYDAKICRFISADGYVSTGQGILGNNMFAYCGNNPVNHVDPTGEIPIGIIIVIIMSVVLLSSCSQNEPTEEQIQNAIYAAEKAQFNKREENGYTTLDIEISTQDTMDIVDFIAYDYYFDTLYDRYLEEADLLGIDNGKLMTEKHIKWEFQIHVIGQFLNHSSADPAELNVEETFWTIARRVFSK